MIVVFLPLKQACSELSGVEPPAQPSLLLAGPVLSCGRDLQSSSSCRQCCCDEERMHATCPARSHSQHSVKRTQSFADCGLLRSPAVVCCSEQRGWGWAVRSPAVCSCSPAQHYCSAAVTPGWRFMSSLSSQHTVSSNCQNW